MPEQIKNIRIRMGGLMRCCIQTLEEEGDRVVNVGDHIDCKYESPGNQNMVIFKDPKGLLVGWNPEQYGWEGEL